MSEFQGYGSLRRIDDLPSEFEATNRRIRFSLPLYRSIEDDLRGKNFVDLYCNHGNSNQSIVLFLTPTVHGYARYSAETIVLMPSYGTLKYAPGTFYIQKTISETESELLTMQKPHRFTVRLDNRTSWLTITDFNPTVISPTQYWDPSSNYFHTLLGKDGFRGQLQINLSSKSSLGHLHRADTILSWMFIIELGLKADENGVKSGPGSRALTPFAALCNVYHDQSGVLRVSDDRWTQVDGGIYIFKNDFRTPLPTYCKVVWDGDSEGDSWDWRKRWVACDVTTNVDTNKKSGIYELVFRIQD